MKLTVLLAAAFTFAFTACGVQEDATNAQDADEGAEVSNTESALTSTLSDEVSQPMSASPETLAMGAATRVGALLKPAGCATQTTNGATVTYVLTNCTGPYGLVKLTGTITAVYSRAANGGVAVKLTGPGLKANNATLDLNADVIATQANGVKTAKVTSTSAGTGPRGASLTAKGDYTVSYDSAAECVTVNGTWQTTVERAAASTVVTNYVRCKGQCPKAGGSIVHTSAAKRVTTMTYDGTANASWSAGGKSGTVTLKCGS